MSEVHVDEGPAALTARGYMGADLQLKVLMSDFDSGPYDFTGATITAAVGGLSQTVTATDGKLVLDLTAAQTTTLGTGTHTWVLKTTEAGIVYPWIHGSIYLSNGGSNYRSSGYGVGIVRNVLVAVG